MSKRVQLIMAILVVVGGGLWLFGATFIRHSLKTDYIGEAGFAVAIGLIAVAAGIVLVIRYRGALRAAPEPGRSTAINEPGDDQPLVPASTTRPLVMWAVGGAWTFLVEPLGFLIATPILIGIELWLLGFRRHVPLVLIAVIGGTLMWIAFDFLLRINLPGGILGPLTDRLHL